MNGAASAVAIDVSPQMQRCVVGDLSLVRMAAENGATRADLLRDLAPLTSHRLSPSELRSTVDRALSGLLRDGAISDGRGRFRLLPAGEAIVSTWLGERRLPPAWGAIRDTRLIAAVLDVVPEPHILKALERPDGLRCLILQKTFGVGGKRVLSASRLRMGLAVVALERAFGNKIKSGLEAGRGLSVKASRLLAGQLARRPRDFGTDTRLISALAAESLGASQSDPNSLRQALLRRHVSEQLDDGNAPRKTAEPLDQMQQGSRKSATETGGRPKGELPVRESSQGDEGGRRPAAASRPDLDGFARTVLEHADAVAEGWPGNRKAFIARVWRAIDAAHPEWDLSDIEFKSMLAEAHRTGHVILGAADIKNKATLKDVQESAIAYKNTVWHFIRVEN
jgi:hypothetical protein